MLIIDKEKIKLDNLELISDKGSECIVYKYNNTALKLFRKDYKFNNLTTKEINYLHNIPTKRILFPTNAIFNKDFNVVGYQMPLIVGHKDIQAEPMNQVLKEMEVLQYDLHLLDKFKIGLFDINPSNSIYNGKLYLIDPGNYIINDISIIKRQIDPLNLCDDNYKLLRNWNENKINQLFDMLLFSQNPKIDPYQFRLIVQFFIKQKESKGINYNLEVFKEFFDTELSVNASIEKFMRMHIKENPKERSWYLSSYKN